MRACSGTWIAHGGGSADRETVDRHDHVRVPPDQPGVPHPPRLALARGGGRATTTASPTRGCGRCATSRTRARCSAPRTGTPTSAVNRRFADAVVRRSEDRGPDRPGAGLPLRAAAAHDPRAPAARDHHHLLAHSLAQPRGLRHLPLARGAARRLLGSSILGFHTQFHCNNFIDTVDRYLEARIDRETFTVSLRRRADRGAPLPDLDRVAAGVAGDGARRWRSAAPRVRERHGLAAGHCASASASTASTTPRGSSSASSRSSACSSSIRGGSASSRSCRSPRRRARSIDEYQDFEAQGARARRAHQRALRAARATRPILLSVEHHDADEVYEYYRAADLCFVSAACTTA